MRWVLGDEIAKGAVSNWLHRVKKGRVIQAVLNRLRQLRHIGTDWYGNKVSGGDRGANASQAERDTSPASSDVIERRKNGWGFSAYK